MHRTVAPGQHVHHSARSAAVKAAAAATLQLWPRLVYGGPRFGQVGVIGVEHESQDTIDRVIGIWRLVAHLAEHDNAPSVADAAFVSIGALITAEDIDPNPVCGSSRRLPRIASCEGVYARLRRRVCGYLAPQLYHLFERAATLSSGHQIHQCGINATRTVSRLMAYLVIRRGTVCVDSPASLATGGLLCPKALPSVHSSAPCMAPGVVSVDVAMPSLAMQWVSAGLVPLVGAFLQRVQRRRAVELADGGSFQTVGIGAAKALGTCTAIARTNGSRLGGAAATCVFLLACPLRPHCRASKALANAAGAVRELVHVCRGHCICRERVHSGHGPANENVEDNLWNVHNISIAPLNDAMVCSLRWPTVGAVTTVTQISHTSTCAVTAAASLSPVFASAIATLDSSTARADLFRNLACDFVRAATQPRVSDLERDCRTAAVIVNKTDVLRNDASDATETFLGTRALVTSLVRGAEKQATTDSLLLVSRQRHESREACYAAFDPVECGLGRLVLCCRLLHV